MSENTTVPSHISVGVIFLVAIVIAFGIALVLVGGTWTAERVHITGDVIESIEYTGVLGFMEVTVEFSTYDHGVQRLNLINDEGVLVDSTGAPPIGATAVELESEDGIGQYRIVAVGTGGEILASVDFEVVHYWPWERPSPIPLGGITFE